MEEAVIEEEKVEVEEDDSEGGSKWMYCYTHISRFKIAYILL